MSASAEAEKDRRSRMAPQNTVNAPAKKDGAGGKHTWGSAMDYGPEDVQTCAVRDPIVIPSKVSVAPETTTTAVVTSQAQTMPEMSAEQFPSLVKLPPGAVMVKPPTPMVWGPGMGGPKTVKPDESRLRSGSTELFDSSHPRNQFARKPRTSSDNTKGEGGIEQPAIDWSSSGTAAMSGAIIRQTVDAAHLNPYMQAAPQVPISTLKLDAQSAQKYMQQPKLSKQQVSMGTPVVRVTQQRGR